MTERAPHEYRTGTWPAVAGDGFVALVEPGTPSRAVDGLWQVAADGGDVLSALEVLAADGFAALPRFAVVRTAADGTLHAVLRGSVALRVLGADGTEDVAAREGVVWTEHRSTGVRGVTVSADAAAADAPGGTAPDATWWPLLGGVVLAGAVRAGARAAVDAGAVEAPAVWSATDEVVRVEASSVGREADDAALPPVREPAGREEAAAHGAAGPDAAPAAADEPEPARGDDPLERAEPSWWSATRVEDVSVPVGAGAPLAPSGPSSPDEPAGPVEVPAPAPPAGAVPAVPAVVPAPTHPVPAATVTVPPAPDAGHAPGGPTLPPVDDHDGMTILSSDLARLRDRLPTWTHDAVPGPFPAPSPEPLPARIVLSTGLVVSLDRAVLIGRAPQVARVTNRELPRLVTVPSPNQDISRTHAEVRVEGEHVVVTDLESTNGVHVSRPGEGVRRLHPGEPSVVGTDEVVDLGDGVTFTVERTE